MHRTAWLLRVVALFALVLPRLAAGQDATSPSLKPEELEQLVAPVALYPDSLLAQVFMASTYPLEVVEAARWSKSNPKVTGDALEQAMQQQSWDPSVKSLTAFPQVLAMMNDQLDWTQKLGDAFLAQQKDVLDAVQRLRAKAKAEGNLESNEQQKVTVEEVAASGGAGGAGGDGGAGGAGGSGGTQTTVIQIEPADPQVVYVPTYNPTTVYGGWPYPAYPPYAWYPPGYVATGLISFGLGMAVGSALWGDCDWGGGDVDIDVNNYNNFNKTDIRNNKWEHKAEHRKGVGYRDQASRDKYARNAGRDAQSRDAFRGRAEQGRKSMPSQQDLAKAGIGDQRAGGGGQRAGAGGEQRAGGKEQRAAQGGGQQRREGGGQQHANRPADRPRHEGVGQGRNPNAFKDMGNAAATREASSRGRVSRQSAQSHGGGGGGRRGGGGGGRRGGGRR